MPNTLTLEAVGVWFVVGLATGGGWTLGAWIITRIVTARPRT